MAVEPTLATPRPSVITCTARVLAAILILFFALVMFLGEGDRRQPLPFALEGAPFGNHTHAQATQLGMLTLMAGFMLSLTGAVLTFLWERAAVTLLISAGLVQIFLWRVVSLDFMHVVVFAMPSLALAALLVLASRRDRFVGRRPERVSERRTSG